MRELFTFSDAVEHGVDYLGGNASDVALRDTKRAIQAAYRDLVNAHTWTYLYAVGRVTATPPYGTGTITYDHTGGAYERMVTLSGGVWPAWADLAVVRLGFVTYKVESRVSDTVVTLTAAMNPGADVTAQSYTLYRESYALPPDYVSQDEALYEQNFSGMRFVRPSVWLRDNRYTFVTGPPMAYTVMATDGIPGALSLRMFPFPDLPRTIDFIYKRRSSPLITYRESQGNVTVQSGSKSLTASGTAFSQIHVGASIRLSAGTTDPPKSRVSSTPPAFETVIKAVASPTSLTLLDAPTADFTGVAYVISDRVDFELGAMLNAFLRGIEKQVGMSRILKDKPSAAAQYAAALAEAKDADSRSFAGRSERLSTPYRMRLRDFPSAPDEP